MHRPDSMSRHFFAVFLIVCTTQLAISLSAISQDAYVQKGGYGSSVGLAHYFGDINHYGKIDLPHLAIGMFYRKQFTNYTALRISAHFAQLGYSDAYNKNEFQQRRNLSFDDNIFEFALQGDFNFFRFIPTEPDHNFTPYLTLGVG